MSNTAIRETLLGPVDSHHDFTEITHEAYMELWDGSTPVYDLLCETDDAGGYRAFIHPVEERSEFVASVSGGVNETTLSVHYRITPTTDIETSLEALEQGGFEHFTPEPPRPGEAPLETVFEAIKDAAQEPADEPTDPQAIFDGRYQCRRCGTVRQIGTFAGAAKPPKMIGTDCEQCEGPRQFDAITPAAEAVRYRWTIEFKDPNQDPYRPELIAQSWRDARQQATEEYPERTIELVLYEDRIDVSEMNDQ